MTTNEAKHLNLLKFLTYSSLYTLELYVAYLKVSIYIAFKDR